MQYISLCREIVLFIRNNQKKKIKCHMGNSCFFIDIFLMSHVSLIECLRYLFDFVFSVSFYFVFYFSMQQTKLKNKEEIWRKEKKHQNIIFSRVFNQ